MVMLERELQLQQLAEAFAQVASGRTGMCAVVSGEAGIGKTTLVQAFVRDLPAATELLQCGCEALFTPRPFGPWVDIASRFPPALERALLRAPGAASPFAELLRFFRDTRIPRVLVVEDVHWADIGTLDLLHYIGRRLAELPLLLVLTHRGDGLDAEHPLQRVLGHLPASTTRRLPLRPLSAQAVHSMAHAAHRNGGELYAATGGNPFYVAEALASPGAIPPSVRDVVLAELARLEPPARALAQWVSLFPGHAERALLDLLVADDVRAVQAAVQAGLLQEHAGAVGFRHEIARGAVYASLSERQRRDGHAAIHAALARAGDTDVARSVHHAEAAGLRAEVAALAPRAAAQAAATGAHREAVRLYALALDSRTGLPPQARAGLLEAMSDELLLINRHRDAIDAREQALAIHCARGDTVGQGNSLRVLATSHFFDSGASGTSLSLAQHAIATLERVPPSRELAQAYSTLSHLHLVGDDMQGAQLWGLRAIELAEQVDDPKALCHALNNVGCARLRVSDDALAWDRLARSLALAQQHDLPLDAARAYNNLFITSVVHHDFAAALRHAEQGIAHCEAQGLDLFNVRIRIRRAFAHIVMGQWQLAEADLAEVAQHHSPSPMEAATHAYVAALLALRRGDAQAPHRLRDAVAAMRRQRVETWFITGAAALVESAWLAGDLAALDAAARPGLARMLEVDDRWRIGELAAWLQRAGLPVDRSQLPALPTPYAFELSGRWRESAAEWRRLGCPYDQALALCRGDSEALREALAIFSSLGAEPAAARVRALLRERGVRGVPRGPQPRTRGDPLGLTLRERTVFDLVCQGLSNAAIARRLHRSERTVEHHVAAVLRKSGSATRVQLMVRRHGARAELPR